MSSLRTTLGGYATYRGREGHWAFLLHRITGLGVVLFLAVHILDTSLVYFAPQLYGDAINIYRSTVFGILEIVLVFCLIFHGVNGLRIAYLDMLAPKDWTIQKTRRSTYYALAVALIIWIPSTVVMLYNLLKYNFGLFGG